MNNFIIEELKEHLEVRFENGMTWENHGELHVDHRRPCASFDLTKEEDIKPRSEATQRVWGFA